jgi:hypothetical protein
MNAKASTSDPVLNGPVLPGILTGLVPLALFVAIGVLAALATLLARTLTHGEPFLTQQPVLGATLGIGLLLAFGAWIAGWVWAYRTSRAWERVGASLTAAATLWTLGAATLILLLPVILAIVIPQHPAHPAP